MGRDKNEIIGMARTTRTIIKVLAAALGLLYVWLKLSGLPIGEIVGGISDDMLVKIALCLYFLSWVQGTLNDTNEQETAYAKAPNRGRFPREGMVACVVVAAVFAILCYVDSAKWFAFWLMLFLVANFGGYHYLRSVVKPAMDRSRDEYKKAGDIQGGLKLEIVRAYLVGKWQWFRFAYGFAAIGVITTMCHTQLPEMLNVRWPAIPPQTYIALSIFFYVITFEGWIWVMRVWNKLAQRTVDFVFEELREQGGYPAGDDAG
jgi:hypothetical protein